MSVEQDRPSAGAGIPVLLYHSVADAPPPGQQQQFTVTPADFAELLLVEGVGARTVRALALVAEVIHGAPCRFSDPARFSLAHGGKDGHPFPVPLKAYDETIGVLKSAVAKAKLGREEELSAMRRLDDQARRLERSATGPAPAISTSRRLAPSTNSMSK